MAEHPDVAAPKPAAVPVASPVGAPANRAPAKGAPAKGAPAKGAPAKGAPAKGAPAKGAPKGPAPGARPAPCTLAFDIGGTGLKASVLGPDGAFLADRVRIPTPYPCPPDVLVASLVTLAATLPPYDRISAGFPGMVRAGRVLSAPHLSTATGPGSKRLPELVKAWSGYAIADALSSALGKPARVVNDADLQGADVVKGIGLEVVLTLGTGMGSAVYYNGVLAPHLELSQHPFRKGQTYDEQVGDVARRMIGDKRWNGRVAKAVATVDALLLFDHLYLGGGNARRVTVDLGPKVSRVDNIAGIAGGFKLWASP